MISLYDGMKIIYEDENKRIYTIEKDNVIHKYTVLNMGDYVGHKSRDFFDPVPDCWRLMQYEQYYNNKLVYDISALIDSYGQYIRVVSTTDKSERIITFNGKSITKDKTYFKKNSKNFGKTAVTDYDSYEMGNISITNHLWKHRFTEPYDCSLILNFLRDTDYFMNLDSKKSDKIK